MRDRKYTSAALRKTVREKNIIDKMSVLIDQFPEWADSSSNSPNNPINTFFFCEAQLSFMGKGQKEFFQKLFPSD